MAKKQWTPPTCDACGLFAVVINTRYNLYPVSKMTVNITYGEPRNLLCAFHATLHHACHAFGMDCDEATQFEECVS